MKSRVERLEAFFEAVCNLTLNHGSISCRDSDGYQQDWASVSPSKLGAELEKVDPQWYSEFERRVTRLMETRGMSDRAASIVVKKAMGFDDCH